MAKGGQGLLTVASAVVVAAGIQAARPVLTPVLLAALITMATAPLLNFLRRHRVSNGLAIVAVVVIVLGILLLLGTLIGTSVNVLVTRLPQYEAQLRDGMESLRVWLAGHGMHFSSALVEEMVDPAPVLSLIGRLLQGLASLLSMAFLILVVVAFMLLESLGLRDKLGRIALGPQHMEALENASRLVDRYLAVKTGSSAVTGLLVGVWTALLGLELAVLWGIVAFVLNYVPTVGSILAAIPAVVLATLQLGPGVGALVALGYLVINIAIGNGIEPKVMGAALGLSPLVVFFSLLLWGFLLGPVGALVSVPLTIIVRIYMANAPELAWISVLLGPAHEDDIAARARLLVAPESLVTAAKPLDESIEDSTGESIEDSTGESAGPESPGSTS